MPIVSQSILKQTFLASLLGVLLAVFSVVALALFAFVLINSDSERSEASMGASIVAAGLYIVPLFLAAITFYLIGFRAFFRKKEIVLFPEGGSFYGAASWAALLTALTFTFCIAFLLGAISNSSDTFCDDGCWQNFWLAIIPVSLILLGPVAAAHYIFKKYMTIALGDEKRDRAWLTQHSEEISNNAEMKLIKENTPQDRDIPTSLWNGTNNSLVQTDIKTMLLLVVGLQIFAMFVHLALIS